MCKNLTHRPFRTSGRWYQSSLSVRRLICIMLMRSYAPIKITAGKLYALNLENFSSVRELLQMRFDMLNLRVTLTSSLSLRLCARHSLTSQFSVRCSERSICKHCSSRIIVNDSWTASSSNVPFPGNFHELRSRAIASWIIRRKINRCKKYYNCKIDKILLNN